MDRFLIAPINSGLQNDLRPWLIPDDAFTSLENAYVFRGRVRKRFGSTYTGTTQFSSRLAVGIGSTDGAGAFNGFVYGVIYAVGQAFSIGTQFYTVTSLGTPANLLNSGAGTATYNTTTGAVAITGAAINTPVYWYPAQPVMGIFIYESGTQGTPISYVGQPSLVFDTQFVYQYLNGQWIALTLGNVAGNLPIVRLRGADYQFIWACTFPATTPGSLPSFFFSNYNATIGAPAITDDPMSYLQLVGGVYVRRVFTPAVTAPAPTVVQSALILLPFKQRLVLLNVVEQTGGVNTRYASRCRYSWYGDPTAATAFSAAGSGFVDAPTQEPIVSAEFVKDRLIVYFSNSAWELVYTANQILPFVWQKINTELGSQSTFSTVPFDTAALTVGTVGIHACTGANVERIDNKIPDEVFEILIRNNGVFRVYGVRDYYVEQVYWSFPSTESNAFNYFPNQVIVFNYKTGSWAINDDCITAFGYFEQQVPLTWASSAPIEWQEAEFTWNAGPAQANFRQVLAGNQQGFMFTVDSDESRNAGVMQITAIVPGILEDLYTLTIINHTLSENTFIAIENLTGSTVPAGINFKVLFVTDANTVVVEIPGYAGNYTGGGTVARVSQINIESKQWNPYVDKGRNLYLSKIDFCVLSTANGQILANYFPSSSELPMVGEAQATGTIMGTSILETFPYLTVPYERTQVRLWHPIYFQTDGEFFQLLLTLNDALLANQNTAFSDFQLEGLVLWTNPTGYHFH
jgi:hypothetical protein